MMFELYREHCKAEKLIMTLPGVALWLGFADKQSLWDYQEKELFTDGIKKIRTTIENQHIQGTGQRARDIFMLKNMGYSDRQQVEVAPVTVVISGKDTEF